MQALSRTRVSRVARLSVSAAASPLLPSPLSATPALPCSASASSSLFVRHGTSAVRMRVVLRETSELGPAHSVLAVSRGYGRNDLIRNGKADYATAENIALAAARAAQEKEARRLQALAEQQAPVSEEDAAAAKSAALAKAQAEAASAAAVPAAKAVFLSDEDTAFYASVVRRLKAQQPLEFRRAAKESGSRDSDQLRTPLTLREVYTALSPSHPTVRPAHISFAPAAGATAAPATIETYGKHTLHVRVTGETKPVEVYFYALRGKRTAAQKALLSKDDDE